MSGVEFFAVPTPRQNRSLEISKTLTDHNGEVTMVISVYNLTDVMIRYRHYVSLTA